MGEYLRKTIKVLQAESCEDAVSRISLLNKLDDCYKEKIKVAPDNMAEGFMQVEKLIMQEPSVTPTRKKGKWIFSKTIFDKHGFTVECWSCHKKWKTYDEIRWKKENKFCPNCGEPKENEG
jgi:NADH pyrophosphatase NudC (nudix superfamily)